MPSSAAPETPHGATIAIVVERFVESFSFHYFVIVIHVYHSCQKWVSLLPDTVGLAFGQVVLDRTANRALVREVLANHALRSEGASDFLSDATDSSLGCC